MKAAIYARVSTADKGQDPELQVAILKEFANRRGYYVDQSLIYIDHASGKDDNRPRFKELMEDARKGRFEIILITKIDRMMRSLTNLLMVMGKLEKWNVALECSDQDIETRSAQGRLFIQILGAFAEWEREMIRERVKAGMDHAKAQGKNIGRPKGAKDKKKRRSRKRPILLSYPASERQGSEET